MKRLIVGGRRALARVLRLYGRTFAGNPPTSVTEPVNHLIYSATPNLTVTADDKTKVYGTNDPAQTFSVVGFVSDDGVTDTAMTAGLTGAFARVAGESTGARAITQGTFASTAGYGISFTAGSTLTITQAPLTGSLSGNGTKVYGASDPAAATFGLNLNGVVNNPAIATWNGNVAIDDTANVAGALTSLTRVAGENVGAYNYTSGTIALSGAAAANYSGATLVPGNLLNITPAPLTVTANDGARTVGLANPAFTATYSGFQFGETPAVLAGALAFATPATIASPAGAYAITPSGQASANYALTYVNGTLTVSGASPAVVTSAVFAPQLAAMQRVAVSETRWQPAACRCVAGTAQGISMDAVVASSSRNCESALNDDIFDVATPGVCFFVSSNY